MVISLWLVLLFGLSVAGVAAALFLLAQRTGRYVLGSLDAAFGAPVNARPLQEADEDSGGPLPARPERRGVVYRPAIVAGK